MCYCQTCNNLADSLYWCRDPVAGSLHVRSGQTMIRLCTEQRTLFDCRCSHSARAWKRSNGLRQRASSKFRSKLLLHNPKSGNYRSYTVVASLRVHDRAAADVLRLNCSALTQFSSCIFLCCCSAGTQSASSSSNKLGHVYQNNMPTFSSASHATRGLEEYPMLTCKGPTPYQPRVSKILPKLRPSNEIQEFRFAQMTACHVQIYDVNCHSAGPASGRSLHASCFMKMQQKATNIRLAPC